MDYGLLGGLAEGIKQGVASYQDARRYNDEQERRNKQDAMAAQMAADKIQMDGYERDPLSKGLVRSKGYQDEEKSKRAFELEKIRASKENKFIDPLEAEYKRAQIDKLKADTGNRSGKGLIGGSGKMLPPDKVLAVQEGSQIPKMLQDLKGTLESSKDMFGPVAGRLAGINPYNEKATTADAQLRTSAQSFGRFMEGGVLRKEDEEKYRKMFPQLSDTPEVAANKLALVERLLAQKQEGSLGALQASGYDTSGISAPLTAPAVPGILSKKSGGGLIKSAQAESTGPKKGEEQDGYVFLGGNPADQSSWRKK